MGTGWGRLSTVNLMLLEAGDIAPGGTARVQGRRAEHLRRVLRVEVGDELRVGVVRGPTGTATVTEIADAGVELKVAFVEAPPSPPDVELILAVPRPKAMSRVVQHAAAWGVRRIDLVNAWRVEKSYFDSPRLDGSSLQQQALL